MDKKMRRKLKRKKKIEQKRQDIVELVVLMKMRLT